MSEQLETDLRRELARKAAGIPVEAVERVSSAGYRASGRRAPRGHVGLFASAASAIGGGVVAGVLLTGSTPAFAGWTSAPKVGHQVPPAAAASSCLAQLATLPTNAKGQLEITQNGSGIHYRSSTPSVEQWTLVVTDVRGPYTLSIYDDQGNVGTCITGPSLTQVAVRGPNFQSRSLSVGTGQGNEVHQYLNGSSGDVAYPSGSKLESSNETQLSTERGPLTIMEAQVASDVTAATLVLQDGSDVGTTIGGGWLVAWWPSDEQAVSAQVTTASGATTQTLDLAPGGNTAVHGGNPAVHGGGGAISTIR